MFFSEGFVRSIVGIYVIFFIILIQYLVFPTPLNSLGKTINQNNKKYDIGTRNDSDITFNISIFFLHYKF